MVTWPGAGDVAQRPTAGPAGPDVCRDPGGERQGGGQLPAGADLTHQRLLAPQALPGQTPRAPRSSTLWLDTSRASQSPAGSTRPGLTGNGSQSPSAEDRVLKTHTQGSEDPRASPSWPGERQSDTRGGGKTHGRVCPGRGRGDRTLGRWEDPGVSLSWPGERRSDTRGGGKTHGCLSWPGERRSDTRGGGKTQGRVCPGRWRRSDTQEVGCARGALKGQDAGLPVPAGIQYQTGRWAPSASWHPASGSDPKLWQLLPPREKARVAPCSVTAAPRKPSPEPKSQPGKRCLPHAA